MCYMATKEMDVSVKMGVPGNGHIARDVKHAGMCFQVHVVVHGIQIVNSYFANWNTDSVQTSCNETYN